MSPIWGAYAVSKAALEMMALTYAAECERQHRHQCGQPDQSGPDAYR